MDLIDKEHIVLLQRGEDACQIARLVEHRAAGELEAHAEFVGDDVGKRGLSQSGRTMEQGVVEGLATIFGSLDEHLEILYDLLLSTEVAETQGAQGVLKVFLAL